MSAAVEIQIADAQVASLNAHTFSLKFNKAARKYVPQINLEEMDGLYMTVAAASCKGVRLDRLQVQYDYATQIGIQKKVKADDEITLDALMGFKQEIGDWFQAKEQLQIIPGVCQVLFLNDPIYDPAKLLNENIFQSVLSFGYRTAR